MAFPFTHDLEGLLELCAASGLQPPEEIVRDAGALTPYAVRHRYGGDPPGLLARDAAVRLAGSAVDWADQLLAG
ncbi:MAG TPA: HEPN domain-containing protein [Solirubrobacteraceae bacterium]